MNELTERAHVRVRDRRVRITRACLAVVALKAGFTTETRRKISNKSFSARPRGEKDLG